MSMLTPPGSTKGPFGGRRGPKPVSFRPGRNRGRRRAALAVLAVVVLAALGWGGTQLYRVYAGDSGKEAAAKKHCAERAKAAAARHRAAVARAKATAAHLPKPGAVTVNVYNATAKTGLAKDTADALKKRGFKIGKIGNAPKNLDKHVKGTAALVSGRKDTATGARALLGTQVAGPSSQASPSADGRKDGSVDLVLGDTWHGLSSPADASRARAAIADPPAAPAQDAVHCG